ncbi:F-box/LRR-repeat protein 3 [Rhynchospora pubera]|uniref:F-box/LRR-repeat protein 3 n=1 Tax=Rhynchospora pubera TaxID=906938 RepID=A0AAV8F5H5_9POAL|nr:F-box/LRR-repeat protein 3 [Rhynchospora pubera]
MCDITAVLTVDLLAQVLDWLHDSRDLKSCRLVSRAFLQAERMHRRAIRPLRLGPLPVLLRRYVGSLQSLDLSSCPSLDDSALSLSIPCPNNLLSVSLSRATGVTWRGLEVLASVCPRIEAIDISHCVGFGDREAAAVAKACWLKELRIDKCLNVTDVGLAKVAVGCSRLEKLGIKWCFEISEIGIDLLVKKCLELRELDISYLKVGNESLRSIASLSKLEDLALVGCEYIDDEGLYFLSNGNCSLQSIDISRCENVTSVGLTTLAEGQQRLRKINAGNCSPVLTSTFVSKLCTLGDTLIILKLDKLQLLASALEIVGKNCRNLLEIGLSKCNGVNDEGISWLVEGCTNLSTIDLTCCLLVTDKSLLSIAACCRGVKCLRLESCVLISEKGLDQIASCCMDLKEIDLTDCNVNDNALKCLSRCSELLVLKIGLCSGVSDIGLSFIGTNCSKLLELDLYRCTAITDDGLAAISNGCKRLKKLNLCYCNQISDTGLAHLQLEELSDLELRGMVRITSSGITAMAMGCRSLTQLDLKRCYSIDDAGMWALAQYTENLRQLTISYCTVTGLGLCHILGSLRCLQDVKMVHLSWVSIEGFELALRASCGKLKKVKLLGKLQDVLSSELLQTLQARGCRIRWVNKPLVFKG